MKFNHLLSGIILVASANSFGQALFTCGDNAWGQQGLGNTSFSPGPNRPLASIAFVKITSGGNGSQFAVDGSGNLWAWGENGYATLGIGNYLNQTFPTQVSGVSNVIDVSDSLQTVAILQNGTAMGWGANGANELGIVGSGSYATPQPIPGVTMARKVACGGGHTLILNSKGRVFASGANQYGQLGVGDFADRSSFTQVPYLTGVTAISASTGASMALKSDGTVWCWGSGKNGTNGTGNYPNRKKPTQVPGLTGVVAIASGIARSVALKSDGTIWTWGYSYLGDGSMAAYRPSPVQVTGISTAVGISAGAYNTMATLANGTVMGWGHNLNAQLGFASGEWVVSPTANGMTGAIGSTLAVETSIVMQVAPIQMRLPSMTGGSDQTINIDLNGPSAGSQTLHMTSSDPSIVTVPGNTIVVPGTTQVHVTISSSIAFKKKTVLLTASMNGVSFSRYITVNP
ncbi:hypothetical protein BH11ARM1_BH11ARM1_02970 [soil metagenome]